MLSEYEREPEACDQKTGPAAKRADRMHDHRRRGAIDEVCREDAGESHERSRGDDGGRGNPGGTPNIVELGLESDSEQRNRKSGSDETECIPDPATWRMNGSQLADCLGQVTVLGAQASHDQIDSQKPERCGDRNDADGLSMAHRALPEDVRVDGGALRDPSPYNSRRIDR